MPKSRFETILKHREWIEDKVQRELAEIKYSLKEEEQRLASYDQLRKDALRELHLRQRKGTFVSEVLLYFSFLNQLSMQIRRQKGIIDDIRSKFSKKLEELIEASKRKKIVMKIKEKELKELLMEELKKEQRFMDEIGITRYNRDRLNI
ncbi:MAG: flagellar export protein FliJ [Pseudomonadota bacterium]